MAVNRGSIGGDSLSMRDRRSERSAPWCVADEGDGPTGGRDEGLVRHRPRRDALPTDQTQRSVSANNNQIPWLFHDN